MALGEEALAHAHTVRDKGSEGDALGVLARLAQEGGDAQRAAALGREHLRLGREVGETGVVALALTFLGAVA